MLTWFFQKLYKDSFRMFTAEFAHQSKPNDYADFASRPVFVFTTYGDCPFSDKIAKRDLFILVTTILS